MVGATFIGTELAKYNLPDAVLDELKEKYMSLKVSSPDDMENYIAAKEGHQEVKKLRVNIEKKRKELKEASLEYGRAVDTEAKRLTAKVLEIEDHLEAQRKVVEAEAERKRKEKEEAERLEQERLKREEEERMAAVRREQEEKEAALKAESDRIEAEKRKIEEEKEKLKLAQDRAEQEKKEAVEAVIRIEREKKEREEREARHKQEVEKAAKEAAEKAAILAEVKAKKEAAEKEAAEIKEKKEAARLEALKPDVEKLKVLARNIEAVQFPEMQSEQAARIANETKQELLKISNKLLNSKL